MHTATPSPVRGPARERANFLPLQRLIWPVLVVALALLSVFALGRGAQKVFEPRGAIDLHPYWYYAHYIRAGVNPYTAFAEEAPLPAPVQYIDGSVVAPDAVRQPRLAQIPANTAPLLFVFTLLSYFPWATVRIVWLVICLMLVLAIPWLALRLLPSSLQLGWGQKWMVALAFYAMKGPRVAIANGQPSILIFFLMILALLWRRHWLWAGLALGLALSKYSIALPVALYLLFERRFRLLLVAALVQGVGLLGVAVLDGGGIVETVQVYLQMALHFTDVAQGSVHLGSLLRDLPWLVMPLVVIGSLVTLLAVVISWRRGWAEIDLLAVNSLLLLWVLLASYHRVYDTMLMVFFWILCLSAAAQWQLGRSQRYFLGIFWLISVVVMCLPGESVPSFLSEERSELLVVLIDRSVTVIAVAMWVVNLWLLAQRPRHEDPAVATPVV